MKLYFHRILIENFLSIGSANIDLRNRGYSLVKGVNNNPVDAALSNGSGKSSIFEALVWCLTGETIRGVKDVVNMFAEGGTMVSVCFDVDNDTYIITRYKDHAKFKTDLKIQINGEDRSGKGIRDSQKLLESYLPELTSSLVGSVIVLGQGLPQRFTNNTPQGRKEVLEQLSKSDFMIEDLKQRLQTRKSFLQGEQRKVEDSILETNTKISMLQRQSDECTARLAALEDPSLYDTLLERTQEKITYLEQSASNLKENVTTYKHTAEQLTEDLNRIQTAKQQAIYEIELQSKDEINRLQTEIQLSNQTCSQLQTEIRNARNIKDTCPTCGRKFDNVFVPNVEPQELALKAEQLKVQSLQNELQLLRKQSQDKTTETCVRFNSDIQATQLKLNVEKAHVSNTEASISDIARELASEHELYNKYLAAKNTYNTTVETLNNTISANTSEIENLNKNLVYYTDEKTVLEERLSVLSKFNTIASRDFRGYLLKNVIEFIDNKAKAYCNDVFGNRNIDFLLSGNNLDIHYCNKQYEACSGGEKQKVDLIIQFAIRDMLCQFLNFSSSIIVLDEIFDNLDTVGCERVLNLISQHLTDIESVFIITHHSDLQIPEDSNIIVTKQPNGVSNVL